ncbi:hypothetical protein [Kitasatospora albolonga]
MFLRQDEYGRYFSALIYLPRDRYNHADPAAPDGPAAAGS